MTEQTASDAPPAARVTPSLTDAARGGPGRALREARERAHLSLEEVAARTRLPRTTVDALERDDFAALSDAVYARGYYRKCGKVLGLSEQELMERYDALAGPLRVSAPTKLLLAGGAAPPLRSRGLPAWVWVSAIAVGVLIAAGAVWHAGVPHSGAKLSSNSGTVTTGSMAPPPAAVGLPPPQAPPVAPTPASPVAAQVAAGPPPPSPSDNIAPAEEHPAAAAPAPPAAAKAASAPLAAVKAAPAAVLAPTQDNDLALNFAGSSYVRVQDSTGRMLLNSKVDAGNNQVLTGRPPYRIYLGNAGAVEVHFHGATVDLKPFVRQNRSASLKVPAS